ncbi:GPW/gp25 family protein [Pseudactinotalea sp. Z1748]|uniref:GPW/gp25 family protein n=1 Tax=Pseudactinotalea sp. Z1748 TaxID=3413027 RepID=UPI003C7B7B54
MRGPPSTHVDFPLRVTGQRRTALADDDGYLRGLVEAVIFTRPGERVNRPDFGSGVDNLVFAPGGGELVESTKALVHGALQRALGDLVRVEDVAVEADEATLRVTIVYLPLTGGAPGPERRSMTVTSGAGAPP